MLTFAQNSLVFSTCYSSPMRPWETAACAPAPTSSVLYTGPGADGACPRGSGTQLARSGVAPCPGGRVARALDCSVHHAGHSLHHHSTGRLAVEEIQERAELGRRDHVGTAVRVHAAQVVEDE